MVLISNSLEEKKKEDITLKVDMETAESLMRGYVPLHLRIKLRAVVK